MGSGDSVTRQADVQVHAPPPLFKPPRPQPASTVSRPTGVQESVAEEDADKTTQKIADPANTHQEDPIVASETTDQGEGETSRTRDDTTTAHKEEEDQEEEEPNQDDPKHELKEYTGNHFIDNDKEAEVTESMNQHLAVRDKTWRTYVARVHYIQAYNK